MSREYRVKDYLKLIAAIVVMVGIMHCSRITEKVEQKVNEKIDQKIDESMKKLDSSFSKEKLDSLGKLMDSVTTKEQKKPKK